MVKRKFSDTSENVDSGSYFDSGSDFGIQTSFSCSHNSSSLVGSSESESKKYHIFYEESDSKEKSKVSSITSKDENSVCDKITGQEKQQKKQKTQTFVKETGKKIHQQHKKLFRKTQKKNRDRHNFQQIKGSNFLQGKRLLEDEQEQQRIKEEYFQLQKMFREQICQREREGIFPSQQKAQKQTEKPNQQLRDDQEKEPKIIMTEKKRVISRSRSILTGKQLLPNKEQERQAKEAGVRKQQVRFEGDWICPKDGCSRLYTIKSNLISHIRRDHPGKCGKIIKKILIPKRLQKINVLTKKFVEFCLYRKK